MEGDLSLSQSLGGLRIANPDAASSPSSQASDTRNRPGSISPLSAISPSLTRAEEPSNLSLFQTLSDDSERPPSPLDFNPNAFSTESISLPKPQQPAEKNPSSPSKDRSSYAQRQANRQSIPLTYQDQQQAQFPQYPTIVPLNQRHPSSSARPVSALYTQTPSSSASSNYPKRQSSYRQHGDSGRRSNPGIPQRSGSRGASTAMQAGVTSEDVNYQGRIYRNSQQMNGGNGALPPRRSSRGIVNATSYPADGVPASSTDEWEEKGAAVGVRQEIDANGRPVLRSVSKGVKDFNFGRTLGEGSYSTVMAATDRKTNREYAMKVLSKHHIIKEKKVKYVTIEKDALNRLTDHPGVVRLYYTFQDQRSLYYVLDLCTGGELLGVLKRMTTFDEECTRFYGAQILDTIDFMHGRGVIHRDLKPENVLLDGQMHVKITDFGTAKLLDVTPKKQATSNGIPSAGDLLDGSEESRANSFVGTAEYVSPELLKDKNACKASDLWAFGCIIYQLLAGRPPFKAGNEYLTFQKIIALNYEFPKGFPEVAKDLVERLLVLDPARRLTIDHVRNHEFFDGIRWGPGLWKQKAPKLKSFIPDLAESIKLNGQASTNGQENSYPPNIQPSHSTHATHYESGPAPNGAPKPSPRLITELAPPTQLDIEWSPVLTKSNERILKLGNLIVLSSPAPSSPKGANGSQAGDSDAPKKFSRFFGSGAPKKRQRLVMITSSGRVIMTAAGGEEKKTKSEISLLAANCAWRKVQDSKGLNHWCIDTREKHFTFEDPKSTSSDGSATSAAAQEWLDIIDVAREMALSQNSTSSYDADSDLQNPSTGSTRDLDLDSPPRPETYQGRSTLQKAHNDHDSFKGRKRFSKRQSKSGLAAVF
ncbi:MAG: hypothetical protein Q9195_004334 [Heterodermia aff. obscurata]